MTTFARSSKRCRGDARDADCLYFDQPDARPVAQAEKQKEANGLIKRYIESDNRLAYINIWDALLGPDGQPRPDLHIKDRLHPSAAGYKIRAEIINKYLETLTLPKK